MRLEELFATVLNLPEAEMTDDTAPLTTHVWTSLVQIQIVVALEDVYGVTLSASEIRALTSLGEARRILVGKGVDVG
ncbi:acyl carrier protein [Streptomyces sp. P17]|uniref:acyl carrier protein n=1 Tax=Streptomyces sp. P17 TaxID=3074716 RepID=UPI0028F41AB1|nr:acyl carrier protein [Streptomyces sp. P17]MDT9701394.1 acyl carrier protein [Streptomyces sp. P17]